MPTRVGRPSVGISVNEHSGVSWPLSTVDRLFISLSMNPLTPRRVRAMIGRRWSISGCRQPVHQRQLRGLGEGRWMRRPSWWGAT
jgi:hypothetical protein